MSFPFLPTAASTGAARVDALYLALTGLSLLVLGVVFLPMVYFLFKYRRGHPADRRAMHLPTLKIEITWTVIPFLISIGLFAWGAQAYLRMEIPPSDTLEINVIAKQWMWKIQHQEGNREINELHIPVGRPVKLTLASEDVIHSFYVPAFRIKQDVVPGRFTTEWFQPSRVGDYHLFCAEFCGTDHSRMIGTIHVMPRPQYAQWLRSGSVGGTLAQAGEKLARELGCTGCHAGNGTVRAPRLEGLYGKPVPLQDRTVVVADDKYLRDSILLPALQVVAGYEPVMPTFQGHIGEEELVKLIAYIKSLANQQPREVP